MNNTQRISISMPGYLYEQLQKYLEPGERSSFVVQALEKQMQELRAELRKMTSEKNPIDEFIALGDSLPGISHKKIMKAIHKGRLMTDTSGNIYKQGYK